MERFLLFKKLFYKRISSFEKAKVFLSKDLPFGRRVVFRKRKFKHDAFLERNIIMLPCLEKRVVI